MEMQVPAGILQAVLVLRFVYIISSSGATRCCRDETAGWRRRPSWMTALRYGRVSTWANAGRRPAGTAIFSSARSLCSLLGFARRWYVMADRVLAELSVPADNKTAASSANRSEVFSDSGRLLWRRPWNIVVSSESAAVDLIRLILSIAA